jgi:tRNA1Val (adenine37-N6)-methyltransferase
MKLPTDPPTSRDGFLGGRVVITQPVTGFRASMDAVLLAAAVPAKPNQTILELGCGVGTAFCCLSYRVAGLSITGVELQQSYAGLAIGNAAANSVLAEIMTADLSHPPEALKQQSFDQVMMNPPFYATDSGTPSINSGRDAALREQTPLSEWTTFAAKRLKQGGFLTIIVAADRLQDLLLGLPETLGSSEIKPVHSRRKKVASRILLRARKGGRAALKLFPALEIHEQEKHEFDGKDFTHQADEILSNGVKLVF